MTVRTNNKLTARQKEVLRFIEEFQLKHGVVPSTREIQAQFGFASQTAAMNHLRALERKGVIQRQPGKARAVAMVSQLGRNRIIDVPIYGCIAAGFAETSEQDTLGTVSVDAVSAGIRRNARTFALRVRGDSMTDAKIDDGDVVILEHKQPRHGDIVAALIDGETTLKRLVADQGTAFLKAENPRYPELYPARELVVQGVMVALVRRYRH
jgi:repressor LexA